ncbi:MAG: DNA polymerase IV [Prevotella sp.]|uniref:DNA polymerase IV n=1 Tax=unclassified Dysgonomonas TaxID=2630389 RepID=UPI0025C5F686|nr:MULTISPECIES: DNA polymerase IV [unclassified Dysgonomonas]MDR1715349.1 DNA polymerase IV [Prevotella sp.]MDR2003631.1 DNA polymerase IV [Prevotella sp.]HMM01629.1 DNA polymerase IV [Dysgonomonas sp.]
MRKIIHIDMDAFYASIEQRDNKEYRGKPLAVGYSGPRGVVAAASYEARRYGVRSAMASKTALRKCPQLIFVPARFDVYKSVSRQIMEIFHEYTDLVEPLSLDEAFLDVTENHKNIPSATQIAQEIKQKILETTRLTASAGVSFNKFLAKIASDQNKPNGLFVVKPKNAEQFVDTLAIEQFFGVGKVTAKRMHQLGIKNGWDLKQRSENELVAVFGKAGHIYFQNARAVDDRPVESQRIRKSISSETTFEHDIDNLEELSTILDEVARDAFHDIEKKRFKARTVTLKIKYADFKIITRSKTFATTISDYDTFYKAGFELLQNVDLSPKVRLIGLGLKNNEDEIGWGEAIQLRINFEE